VLHVVLGHIPRSRRMRKTLLTSRDKFLFGLFDNLMADAAANEKLRRNHPGVEDPAQPLGYWVLSDRLMPPQPRDLSYENYLTRAMDDGGAHLKDPKALYTLALRILRQEIHEMSEAVSEHEAAIAAKKEESRLAAAAEIEEVQEDALAQA